MINFFKKIENKVKILHKSRLINPHVHWVFLVQISLLLSLFLIIFSFYLLYKIRNEDIFQTIENPTSNPPSLIKEGLLEKINESFRNKEIRMEEIKAGNVSFQDPS